MIGKLGIVVEPSPPLAKASSYSWDPIALEAGPSLSISYLVRHRRSTVHWDWLPCTVRAQFVQSLLQLRSSAFWLRGSDRAASGCTARRLPTSCQNATHIIICSPVLVSNWIVKVRVMMYV